MAFEPCFVETATTNVDKHIGARLRGRREMLGLSVDAVAFRARIDADVYPSLETGAHRVSAANIFELSRVLGVPVRFFFDLYAGPGCAAKEWASHPALAFLDAS